MLQAHQFQISPGVLQALLEVLDGISRNIDGVWYWHTFCRQQCLILHKTCQQMNIARSVQALAEMQTTGKNEIVLLLHLHSLRPSAEDRLQGHQPSHGVR